MRERIKQIRKEFHLTQAQLAEELHVSKSSVEAYEYGRAEVTDRVIADICRIFGVNEMWLRTGEGEVKAPASRIDDIALITRSILKDDDPVYRDELIKLIADMDKDTIKLWYEYAKRWVESVEEKKPSN